MNDKEFNSWLAGFIDGEGCFNIRKRRTGVTEFRITITQAHERGRRAFEMIKKRLKMGTVHSRGENKPYMWSIYIQKTTDLIKLLREIKPLLVIKVEEAKEFERIFRKYKKSKGKII